ncbi:hypothetical protein WJX75_005572 [Coccomyxa subellipsoidea]|uniref:Ankyrin n=1 Tax=Coccomyxa subellipsoidea TaxID=248742 RepID=A0ABR2Z3T6_9CHLO
MDLHAAARAGNVEELEALIASGSKIDDRDKHSRTPLHMASWAGHEACVDILIKAGANVHSAAMDDMSSLHFAAQQGHLDVCRTLINAGLKINAKTRKGTNALHFAAKKGHVDLVRYLIRRRGNVSARDRKGMTAMDLASDESVKAILQEALNGPKQEESAVSIGPQEQPKPMEKKERGNMRKRSGSHGEQAAHAAEEPAPKRAQKVALSHLGDEDDDGDLE